MIRLAIAAALLGAPVFLAACDPIPNACEQAKTYGEMFGTPESKGPCWGRIISVAHTGNIAVYMLEMPLPGYAIGSVTYQGNELIQAGITRG